MDEGFRFFPDQASTLAEKIDHIVIYLLAVTVLLTGIVFGLMLLFCSKFRRRPGRETGVQVKTNAWLEATWIGVPIVLVLIMFFWGASDFFPIYRPPPDSLDVYVVARQWMWKLQHAEGNPEINELHVPLGRPVRLTMTSQDVIHSFYVPAFRIKQDVLPGRYTTIWFQPRKLGEFHLFCAEYCGTKHSGMVGKIVVLPPAEYERWLSGGMSQGGLSAAGHGLFLSLGCAGCHTEAPDARCPSLVGLHGSTVRLQGGAEAIADESYLRESILDATAKIVSGYQPLMPSFRGRVTEEELIQLVAYVKSLSPSPASEREK